MTALERLHLHSKMNMASKSHYSENQAQTQQTFGFKWAKREVYESEAIKKTAKAWLFERYCDRDPTRLATWLGTDSKIILDAGCGSGFSAALFFEDHLNHHDYLGVDISTSIEIAKMRFQEMNYPGDFLQMNLLDLPLPTESIDLIFSEGVLHHTDDTSKAIHYLTTKLKKGGWFLFYVYAKKAPIREFADDYIREQIRSLSDEEAWEALKPLTKLGKTLGELKLEIDVPEEIPFLEIPKGKITLQELFYWKICKLYYRDNFTLDEMNLINYDWYRPLNCRRHTKEEVIGFCRDAGLSIEHMNVQASGITIVAKKG